MYNENPSSSVAEDPPPYCCFNAAVPVLTVSVDLEELLLPAQGDVEATDPLLLMHWIHTFYVEVDSLMTEFPDLWRFSTMHCTFSIAPLLPLSSNKTSQLVAYARRLMHTCKQVRRVGGGCHTSSPDTTVDHARRPSPLPQDGPPRRLCHQRRPRSKPPRF